MSSPFTAPRPATEKPSPERLDSWKAIAAYLRRDVTTVQRWERREAMPVYRHLHDKRGSVYALRPELDAWRESRRSLLEGDKTPHVEDPEQLPVATQSRAATEMKALPHGPWRARLRPLVLALAVVAACAAAYLGYRSRTENTAAPKITSLAVLPLRNLSGDPSQQYLADGMTEALIGRLSNIRDLRVISHTSVMRFDNQRLAASQIASTLGVDAIVEGSVTRAGDRIRVTAQLIRGATDDHFWSETYDRQLQDVLDLQGQLAQTIADKVEVTLTGTERQRLAAKRTVAPEVYESYLKGRFALNERGTKARVEESVGDFEDAIRIDPTFAPAYLGLAEAFNALGTVLVGVSPEETRPKAMSAARKALELDPDLAEAHVELADTLQREWQWADAEAEYRRALDLSPNNAQAHAKFASWLLCQGRTAEALVWAERGRQLDPLTVSGTVVAWILFQSHRYADAEHELRAVLAVRPDDVDAMATLGFVLSVGDRAAEAVPFLNRAVAASHGSPAATGVLIRAYARSDRPADALGLLGELKEREAAGYVPAGAFVNAYLGLGDQDAAFVWLERAYAEKSNILQFLKVHPFFDPLRNDPRFADLISRVWRDASR